MALSLACNILSRQGSSEPLLPAALLLLDGSEDDLRHRAGKENRVCRRGDMRWAAPQNFFIKESQPLLLSSLPDAENENHEFHESARNRRLATPNLHFNVVNGPCCASPCLPDVSDNLIDPRRSQGMREADSLFAKLAIFAVEKTIVVSGQAKAA